MAGEAVTAMIVAADAGDNPLADRREDRETAAERERKAKVAKLNSQTANLCDEGGAGAAGLRVTIWCEILCRGHSLRVPYEVAK